MQRLGGSHVDSVRQRGHDQSRSVPELLLTLVKVCIADVHVDVLLLCVLVRLELCLPLEPVLCEALLVVQLKRDVSAVSVERDHAHDLGTRRLI